MNGFGLAKCKDPIASKASRKLGQLSKYDFAIIRLDANELNKGPICIIFKAKLVINYIYFKFGLSMVGITIH